MPTNFFTSPATEVDLDPAEPIRTLADAVAVERLVHAPILDSEDHVEADRILADQDEFHGWPFPHRSRGILGRHLLLTTGVRIPRVNLDKHDGKPPKSSNARCDASHRHESARSALGIPGTGRAGRAEGSSRWVSPGLPGAEP